MKKSVLILSAVLITISLLAFGYINCSNTETGPAVTSYYKVDASNNDMSYTVVKLTAPDLVYNVDSRYLATITKEDLHKATSIVDILPTKATQYVASYNYSKVSLLNDSRVSLLNDFVETDKSAVGTNEVLNAAQLKLLQSMDYSSDFYIRADYEALNATISYLTYYISIIPEKEAEFPGGNDALIAYLKENSKEKTAIIKQDQLKPGRVTFTVTKNGEIGAVKLSSTSGYPTVDEELVKIITHMPQKWSPATNSKGENVAQELVFFFGLQGC